MLIAVILGGAVCPEPILKVKFRMIIFPGQYTKHRLIRSSISVDDFYAGPCFHELVSTSRTARAWVCSDVFISLHNAWLIMILDT